MKQPASRFNVVSDKYTAPQERLAVIRAGGRDPSDKVWYPALKRASLRRRVFYQTRHTFASNALAAGEAPSWVAAMLGHTTPEMLFTVYARFIPNRTRRDGSALLGRMAGVTGASSESENRAAVLPICSR